MVALSATFAERTATMNGNRDSPFLFVGSFRFTVDCNAAHRQNYADRVFYVVVAHVPPSATITFCVAIGNRFSMLD